MTDRTGADRAVSEVIAFVLVFAIVITSIGLLYTVGFGSLADIQESEQDDSAERAMSAVAVALEDIQAGRGTSREASIDLAGRSLSVDRSESLTVELAGDSYSADGALVYGSGEGTEIVYQSGAVIRSQGDDAQLVQRRPRFQCTDDHAVISLVDVWQEGSAAVSSDGSVDIVAERNDSRGERLVGQVSGGGPYDVTVDYSGDYEAAWEGYFEAQGWDVSSSNPEATCEVDEAYVLQTGLDLAFEGV